MPKKQLTQLFQHTQYGAVVNSLLEKGRSPAITETIEPEKPFFANPGSQSDLLFNILGFERGEETETVDHPRWQTEEIQAILDKEGVELDYPETMHDQVTLYSVEPPKAFNPKYPNVLIRGANRSGKSTAGAVMCDKLSKVFPHHKGLITANTYDQLRDSTLTVLIEYLVSHNIPFEPWRGSIAATTRSIVATKTMKIRECIHYCRTASDFVGGENSAQAGRGFGVAWVWADEWLRVPTREPFDVLSTRLSEKGVSPIKLITSTINTSNPYNWGYDLFDSEERSPEMKARFFSVTGASIENRHRINETYVQDQYAQMLPELFKIEVLGQYAATTVGKAYNYFKRDRHIKTIERKAAWTQIVMVDFNRSPACATIGQTSGKVIEVYKEIYLLDSDTFQLSEAIARELVSRKIGYVAVFGDATGKNRTANSKLTNWQIVFAALKSRGIRSRQGFQDSNPAVVDRVNAVNLAFMHDELFIDPSCKELIKDWESMQWRDNGDLDKRDLRRSHLSDGVGYGVWEINPMLIPTRAGNGTYTK